MRPLPLKKGPLGPQDFAAAAKVLGVDPLILRAVAEVESSGEGFRRDGEQPPKVNFERHYFDRITDGAFRDRLLPGVHPDYAKISWPRGGGRGPEGLQHRKLQFASELNREAALRSCSWGTFQVMGNNWKECGCKSLQEFVNAMFESSAAHLRLFVGFIKEDPELHQAFRDQDFPAIARIYNGPAAVDRYAPLMRDTYQELLHA